MIQQKLKVILSKTALEEENAGIQILVRLLLDNAIRTDVFLFPV